jgi:hypothetical protein
MDPNDAASALWLDAEEQEFYETLDDLQARLPEVLFAATKKQRRKLRKKLAGEDGEGEEMETAPGEAEEEEEGGAAADTDAIPGDMKALEQEAEGTEPDGTHGTGLAGGSTGGD